MFGSKIVVALATMGLLLVTTPAIAAESGSGLGWSVTFLSRSYDSATDRTTFSYRVSSGSDGSKVKALSHFVVGLPSCESKLEVLATAPSEAVEIGTDPTTGVYGVKWDLSLEPGQSRDYSLTIAGNHAVSEAKVAVKAGKPTATISLSGISCASGDDDTPGDDTPGDDTPGDNTPGCDTPGCDAPGDPGDRGALDPKNDRDDRGTVDPTDGRDDRGTVDPRGADDRGDPRNGNVDRGGLTSDPVDRGNRTGDQSETLSGDPTSGGNNPQLNGGDNGGTSRTGAGCTMLTGSSSGSSIALFGLLLLCVALLRRRRLGNAR